MADLTPEFFQKVSLKQWKDACDLCNGMDMFGMLRALAGMKPPDLAEFKNRLPAYNQWGQPNIARISYALGVVTTRSAAIPAGLNLPADQISDAQRFLALTKGGWGGVHDGALIIEEWAKRYLSGDKSVTDRFLYPQAIPYLAVKSASGAAPPTLADRNYGNLLGHPLGLALHCQAGPPAQDLFGMIAFKTVGSWNNRPTAVSAHFAISTDGTVVQIVPTNYEAFAQRNSNWISVEIDHDGADHSMTPNQLAATRALFGWVCRTFAIPRTVAMGVLVGDAVFDAVTSTICSSAGAATTRNALEAGNSRGLSCHRWLENIKPCPGPGILRQFVDIAKP
jgi:hypothetical protein